MKVFITGSTGLLGTALFHNAPSDLELFGSINKNRFLPNVASAVYEQMDITNSAQVQQVLKKITPEFIIHTAGIGNVDYCEEHQDEAWAVNVEGTRNIIAAAKEIGAKVIFTSTNSIFDGEHPPYNEQSKPGPLEYYGKTKVQSEEDLASMGVNYTLVRLITMYGWNNPHERINPATWTIEKLEAGTALKMVTDVFNNFLKVESAAEAIWKIVTTNASGTYHLAGKDIANRYDFTLLVADIFGLDKTLVSPVTLDYFPSQAPRPKNTCFDTTKMQQVLKVEPVGLRLGLEQMKQHPPQKDHWRSF